MQAYPGRAAGAMGCYLDLSDRKPLPIDYRVIGCIGLQKAGIHKKLRAIHQPCFHTLPDDPFKESPEGRHTPPGSGFTQYALIGNPIFPVKSQKPHPVHALPNRQHQFPLRTNIVEDQKKHHLEDDRKGNRNITFGPIRVLHFLVDEIEVDPPDDLPLNMILSNPLF